MEHACRVMVDMNVCSFSALLCVSSVGAVFTVGPRCHEYSNTYVWLLLTVQCSTIASEATLEVCGC